MKRLCFAAITLTFATLVHADNLHNPDQCPNNAEGDYQAVAPGNIPLILTVARDKDQNLTLTYHAKDAQNPDESATITVDGQEEKNDSGIIVAYCKDNAIYHQLTTPDKQVLSKFTVVPEGLKIEGINPPSEGGIYTKITNS